MPSSMQPLISVFRPLARAIALTAACAALIAPAAQAQNRVPASALEAAGIPAVCFDSGTHLAEGGLRFIPVRVMVDEEDLADAVALRNSAA